MKHCNMHKTLMLTLVLLLATGNIFSQNSTPTEPDVWEVPRIVNSYPYVETLNTTNLNNDYTLPGNATDGKDAVFKLEFDTDVLLTANVTSGENGKTALYRDGFEGQSGPQMNNVYLGMDHGVILDCVCNFENGDFGDLNWDNNSSLPWAITTSDHYEGSYCMKSNSAFPIGSSSSISLTLDVPYDIVIGFWGKISCSSYCFWGDFYIDGNSQIKNLWGSGDWIYYHYEVPQGLHTFKWEYKKVYSAYSGFDDCFYIDNISIHPNYQNIALNNTVDGLTVPSGTYYLVASSTSDEFTVNINKEVLPLPVAATSPTPNNGLNIYGNGNNSIGLSWQLGDYTKEYQVLFGETNPPTTQLVEWTNVLSDNCAVSVNENKTYYWRVNERNGSGVTEGTVWAFSFIESINASTDNIIYVTPTGAGLKDGSSWADAASSIQAAIDYAATVTSNQPVIWVAKGTYTSALDQTINGQACHYLGYGGVKLYGGFNGDEPANYDLTQRNLTVNATILEAENQGYVVGINGSEWDGFEMQHGGTGGVYVNTGSSSIQNCKILYSNGKGIYANSNSGSLICYHNEICHHSSDGIYQFDAFYHLYIQDCIVSFNGRYGILGNMCVRCQLCNNGKGGFYTKSSYGSAIIGCLVANNQEFGVDCRYIVSSTIVNNGKGITDSEYNFNTYVCNSIIWGNGQQIDWRYSTPYFITNNAIQGGFPGGNGIYPCINLSGRSDVAGVQPEFECPTEGIGSAYSGGDWRLKETSPCINMGMENLSSIPRYPKDAFCNLTGFTSAADFLNTDYTGNQRVQQGRIDLGAWESPYQKPNCHYATQPDVNNIIYVKADGQGDGSSWANATSNLQEAIESSILYEPTATIWVAQGTYTVSTFPLQVKEQLKMYGGFEGTEPANYDLSQRDFVSHASVLNGNDALRVLYQKNALSETKSAVIDGFTLRNGTADNGAGAYLLGNTTLSHCTLDHNTASSNGGGIYAENARVENCILMNNTAQQGGGIYAKNAQIVQSIVGNNKATANGGGLYLNNSDLYQSQVVRNEGGGLAIDAADYNTHARLMNNIIWGNGTYNINHLTSAAQTNTTLSYCAVEGLTNHELGNIPLSTNNDNIFGPNFVNPTETVGLIETLGDWHLASVSPCINAGSNTLSGTPLPDCDLDYRSRIFQNGTVDMGVYELLSETLPVVMEFIDASILEGGTYDFFGTVLDTPGIYEHQYTEDGNRHLVLLNLQLLNITYVSENGAGTNDGSSWENALDGNTVLASGYTKLADALQNADGTSCFWVASGTYLCSNSDASKHFVLTEGVRIYGGFAGTETTLDERDLTNNITQFSGEIQNDGVTSNNTDGIFVAPDAAPVWNESAYLDGLTITQGYNATNTKGGALWVGEGAKVTINHCKVTQNWEGSIYNNGILEVRNSDLLNNRKEIVGLEDNRTMPDYSEHAARGAGVLFNLEHGIAYFDNCNFKSNFSEKNGVIFNDGVLSVNESYFYDNTATQFGTIFSWGKVILTNTDFNNNRAMNRIGLMMVVDSLELVNCTLSDNHAHYYTNITPPPGNSTYGSYTGNRTSGIEAWGYSYVDNCQFLNNDGGTRLGGALSVMGTADVKNCTFIGNKGQYPWVNPNNTGGGLAVVGVDSGADGGALYVQGTATATDCVFSENLGAHGSTIGVDGTLTMERCKIVNSLNSIGIPYGAIKVTGNLTIKNSLLANNRDGLLVLNYGAHASFINSTIVNNDATLFKFWTETNEAVIDFDNCIIAGYSEWASGKVDGAVINTTYTLVSQAISGTEGNENDPLFVNPTTYLGYAENVNPLDFDWTLQATSPCINAGDVTLITLEPNAIDLGGNPRVRNGQIDQGAYEYSIIYNFINDGNWNVDANWSGGSVPDEGSDVNIGANAIVPSGYTADAPSIVIADEGASLTIKDGGQLITNSAVEATVEKDITAYHIGEGYTGLGNTDGWHFIASPINSNLDPEDVTGMTFNPYDLYRLNSSSMMWENQKNTEYTDFTVNNGKGYLYANSDVVTLRFNGTIKTYSEESNTVPVSEGWNLIGNPYTFAVYPSTSYYVMNDTRTGLDPEMKSSGVAIAPCTGIIVQAGADGLVAFNNTLPAQQNASQGNLQIALSQVVDPAETPVDRGKSGAFVMDKAVVSFNEGDDLAKFYFGHNNANIYIPQGAEEYAIVSVGRDAMHCVSSEIPVNLKVHKNGEYTLTVSSPFTSHLSSFTYLHLIDNMTGADVDLLASNGGDATHCVSTYTFTSKTTDYESRFKLVFSAIDNGNENDNFAFISDGNIIVNGEGTLQVIDALGRTLANKELSTLNSQLSTLTFKPGVYVVRLINGNDVKVQKVVVE